MRIGIVGAGILGRLLAFTLWKNHEVSIFEQNSHSVANCSMVAAGLLAPVSELEKSNQLIYSLGTDSLKQYWPKIINQLGVNIYFKNSGSIAIAHSRDYAEMQHFISRIDTNYKSDKEPYLKLQSSELIQLEPELDKFNEAYYLPHEGQLDSQAVMTSLQLYLQQHGIEWRTNTCVTKIESTTITTTNGNYSFDLIFDCRGLGAKKVFTDLQSVRGELIWLHAPEVNIARPVRLMHPRYHLYIVPRPNNMFIIGASEIYSEDYSPISVRTSLELLSAAYFVHSGFAEARIIDSHTHCRPAFPHHLPKISFQNSCIAINGLYRHGFLIAPALVKEISLWIEQGAASLKYPQLWSFL